MDSKNRHRPSQLLADSQVGNLPSVQVKPPPSPRIIHISTSSTPTSSSPGSATPTSTAQRRVAIAIDLSDESAYAVNWAVRNYLRPGDAVILLHVRPTSVLYGADWGATPSADNPATPNQQKRMEEDFDHLTCTKASNISQPLIDARVPFKIHIVKDHDLKERLCLEIERLALSAVIMGSRGFGASRRGGQGTLGSVSDYCVNHCACPVVVVRYPRGQKDAGGSGGATSNVNRAEDAVDPVPENEQEYHNADNKQKDYRGVFTDDL